MFNHRRPAHQTSNGGFEFPAPLSRTTCGRGLLKGKPTSSVARRPPSLRMLQSRERLWATLSPQVRGQLLVARLRRQFPPRTPEDESHSRSHEPVAATAR